MVIDGVMLLWFLLTALSLAFVAIDIRSTPEHPVMKWAFVLFTAYSEPIGAFLYVLGCREPLPGLHEQYVSARWRQTLGSTMHCVAGDGVGILVGAVIGALISLPLAADFAFFISHYLAHKVSFLWEFHKVHHSSDSLNPLTNNRFHPVDKIFAGIFIFAFSGAVKGLFAYYTGEFLIGYTILETGVIFFLFRLKSCFWSV